MGVTHHCPVCVIRQPRHVNEFLHSVRPSSRARKFDLLELTKLSLLHLTAHRRPWYGPYMFPWLHMYCHQNSSILIGVIEHFRGSDHDAGLSIALRGLLKGEPWALLGSHAKICQDNIEISGSSLTHTRLRNRDCWCASKSGKITIPCVRGTSTWCVWHRYSATRNCGQS
jgi:hypothetical protein